MSIGITEIVLILVVVLVLFGGKKIPELARGLGKAQAEYKKAKEAIETELGEFQKDAKTSFAKASAEKSSTKKRTVKKSTKKNAEK